MNNHEQEYHNQKRFDIDSAEALVWAMKTYENNIAISRRTGRYLFNKLFDFGKKVIQDEVPFVMPHKKKENE